MKVTLSEIERRALAAFARQQGRQWKASLRQMWEGGNYWGTDTDAPTLQRIRNRIGPSGLVAIRPDHLREPAGCDPVSGLPIGRELRPLAARLDMGR